MKRSHATIVKASAVLAFVLVATRSLVLASVDTPQQELGAQFISERLDLVLPAVQNTQSPMQQCSDEKVKKNLTSI